MFDTFGVGASAGGGGGVMSYTGIKKILSGQFSASLLFIASHKCD